MKFIWMPEYSVGVKVFDEQHKHFFELADKIVETAEAAEVDRESLLERITEFGNYAMYHMAEEEKYFEKYGYPDAPEHRAAHNIYRSQVEEYLERARNSSSDTSLTAMELAEFASHWLIQHILSVDKKYAAFFQGKEIN